jgi:hypothetical protein
MKALRHKDTGFIIPEHPDLPIRKEPDTESEINASFAKFYTNEGEWEAIDIPEPKRIRRPHDMTLTEWKTWLRYINTYGVLAGALALPRPKPGLALLWGCFEILCAAIVPVALIRRMEELTYYDVKGSPELTRVFNVWTLDIDHIMQVMKLRHAEQMKIAGSVHGLIQREYGKEAADVLIALAMFIPEDKRHDRRNARRTNFRMQMLAALKSSKTSDVDREQLQFMLKDVYDKDVSKFKEGAFASMLSKAGGRTGV